MLDTLRKEISRIPLYVSNQDYVIKSRSAAIKSIQVALNLLDSDFHDENIRAFAVEVLEVKLLDEDLEDYILQLTQVCMGGILICLYINRYRRIIVLEYHCL